MNKMNPSAMALMASAAASRLGANAVAPMEASKGPRVEPIDARRAPVPAGYKRVYHGHTPHQGSREMARRQRQQGVPAAAKIQIGAHEAGVELLAILKAFEGTQYEQGHVQQVIRDYFQAHEFTDGADPQTVLDRILAPAAAAAGVA